MSQRTMELMEELGGRGTTLLDVCLNLHMSNTGASDPLPKDQTEKSLHILKLALKEWTPSFKPSEPFDNAVKHLIEVTILETLTRNIWYTEEFEQEVITK